MKNKPTINPSVTVNIIAGVSFDISLMFLQGETPDPSDICLGNIYH